MEYAAYIIIAALVVYSVFFAPEVKPPKASTLEDFEIATAEEGRIITVVMGTREVTSANVVWYGDLKVTPIKKGKK